MLVDLNLQVNTILNAREDVEALIRIHADVDGTAETSILNNAKLRAKAASENLVTLLT